MSAVTPLDPGVCREHVRRALAEDLGWGDVTTDALVGGARRARACLIASRSMVVAGVALAEEAFRQLDPLASIVLGVEDGASLDEGGLVLEVSGNAGAILTAERTARNFIARLSGIATVTQRCVAAARGCVVRSSRDTTPGFRLLEHYAVRVGGGAPYRASLDAGVVATAQHLRFAPDLASGVRQVLALQVDQPMSIEVRDATEIDVALEAGARRLIFGPSWGARLAEGIAHAAGRATLDVVLPDEASVAAVPLATLQHVACVVVSGLTATASRGSFVFVVDPADPGGS